MNIDLPDYKKQAFCSHESLTQLRGWLSELSSADYEDPKSKASFKAVKTLKRWIGVNYFKNFKEDLEKELSDFGKKYGEIKRIINTDFAYLSTLHEEDPALEYQKFRETSLEAIKNINPMMGKVIVFINEMINMADKYLKKSSNEKRKTEVTKFKLYLEHLLAKAYSWFGSVSGSGMLALGKWYPVRSIDKNLNPNRNSLSKYKKTLSYFIKMD